jgi:hypothetical protein
MTTPGSARSLLRDQRGGVEFLAYLMLVALIAFVALAGVRGYDGSVRNSFADSTTRFDRPGTYWGGSVEPLPTGDRGGPPPIPTYARAPGGSPPAATAAPAAVGAIVASVAGVTGGARGGMALLSRLWSGL